MNPWTVHGLLQARILEWVVTPFSRESSQPRDWAQVSCIACRFFTISVTRKAQHLLISWLQSLSTMIMEPKKIKSVNVSIFFPIYLPWSDGTRCYNLSDWRSLANCTPQGCAHTSVASIKQNTVKPTQIYKLLWNITVFIWKVVFMFLRTNIILSKRSHSPEALIGWCHIARTQKQSKIIHGGGCHLVAKSCPAPLQPQGL